MRPNFRLLVGIASMFGASVAFAGHGDADTGFQSNEEIARWGRDAVAASHGNVAPTGQQVAQKQCKVFNQPGLDVVLWTAPCEAPNPAPAMANRCRVFNQPGLDVVLWTAPCDTVASAGKR